MQARSQSEMLELEHIWPIRIVKTLSPPAWTFNATSRSPGVDLDDSAVATAVLATTQLEFRRVGNHVVAISSSLKKWDG